MNTMKRLSAYDTALKKWANKKRVHDLMADAGKPERKPLEPEPLPSQFEIKPDEMPWAEKIRAKIMTPKPVMQNLDNQLPKVKMPVRRIV